MIVCIEGSIGVGKTSLTKRLAEELGGHDIYEEYENNPFLKDFYDHPDGFAFHVQATFLCLQSRQFLRAIEMEKEKVVVADFHPVKSKVFSDIVVKNKTDHEIIQKIYEKFFSAIEQKILVVYLKVTPETVMKRIAKRNDNFTATISKDYIENLINTYNRYFDDYQFPHLVIDTDHLDFVQNENDWLFVKEQIINKMKELDNK